MGEVIMLDNNWPEDKKSERKRELRIGKYKHKDLGWLWVIKGLYNKCVDDSNDVMWRTITVSENELTYLDSVHIDLWCEKLWKKDEIQSEIEVRAELKIALMKLFDNIN